ncbi:MAG: response regulator [Planctomycetaceae bacterium]|nr:response regulator [Planctomycetaceae bacterium]
MIRVMVMEDDRAAMDITCRYVEKVDGFSIVGRAYDGNEAKAMVLRLDPDLIILDNDMPKKNGMELLEELRRENHAVSTLFLTATSDLEIIARAEALGIVDYLVKPIGLDRLRMSLEKCIPT